jgi:glutathione S-transferase
MAPPHAKSQPSPRTGRSSVVLSPQSQEDETPMMKLYSGDLSPYSARVRMQIYAKGIGDITLERPATFGLPAFREQNPIGRIPVLDIDGDLMPESEVIAEYLEEIYPEPSLLGTTPRESAHIRTLARIGDIYLMNNMFMLSPQTRASSRNEGIVELLGGQVVRNIKALERMIGEDGFACCGRLTLADCALVPGLFLVENVLPAAGVDSPILANAKVAAYWAAIQRQEHAAKVLAELHRGLAERRELIRTGAFDKMMAAAKAAMEAAER